MKCAVLLIPATAALFLSTATANAGNTYDGSWSLQFITQKGGCDPSYNFDVNVANGVVTHPNLVRFKGYVANSGTVRASVTVMDKFAAGSGKLTRTSGHGTWSGYSGPARCSGYWVAQRS